MGWAIPPFRLLKPLLSDPIDLAKWSQREALTCMCRLCAEQSKCSHNKFDPNRKIEKVLGADVSSDENFIHPARLCLNLNSLLVTRQMTLFHQGQMQ